MSANVFVSGLFTWNGKALAKGKKDISSFAKSITALGRTMGVAFSAAAIVNFSKTAINAFMKDEAAAKALATQLKNLGYGFATTNVESYIGNLEKSTGVLDDHLRPAFQELLTTTGLVTESQKALNVALDVSAATGMSVEEVASKLAAGYRGQTKGLKTLGVNLSKTSLSAGHMADALNEIGAAYSGQALARLDTYAGKMDLLQGSAARASETIGKGLLDSIAALSSDGELKTFGTAMEKLATDIANAAVGMSDLIAKAKILIGLKVGTGNDSLLMNIPVLGTYLSRLAAHGASIQPNASRSGRSYQGGQTSNDLYVLKKKEADVIKKANAARAAELAALKKKTAIDALKDQFDLERIGLMAALNSATDEETKLRLKSQLAILDNDEALAKKLLAEMNSTSAINEFTNALLVSAEAIRQYLASYVGAPLPSYPLYNYNSMPQSAFNSSGGVSNTPLLTNPNPYGDYNLTPSVPLYGYNSMPQSQFGNSNYTINIDATNMVDSANMTRVVQQAVLEINKTGLSTIPAGQGF
jgi:hypothetical protein